MSNTEYGPPLPDTRLVQRTKPDTDSNPDSSPPGSPAVQLTQGLYNALNN